jgi:hypothetical protein
MLLYKKQQLDEIFKKYCICYKGLTYNKHSVYIYIYVTVNVYNQALCQVAKNFSELTQ